MANPFPSDNRTESEYLEDELERAIEEGDLDDDYDYDEEIDESEEDDDDYPFEIEYDDD